MIKHCLQRVNARELQDIEYLRSCLKAVEIKVKLMKSGLQWVDNSSVLRKRTNLEVQHLVSGKTENSRIQHPVDRMQIPRSISAILFFFYITKILNFSIFSTNLLLRGS